MKTIQTIWRKIYPNDDPHRWMPLMWLPFMLWFFIDPFWHHAGPLLWILNTLYGLVFMFLYLQAFSRPDPISKYCVLAMLAMAVLAMPFNSGAFGFLIYTVAAGSFTTRFNRVVLLVLTELLILGAFSYRLHVPMGSWFTIMLLIVLVGFGNHHWAVAHCNETKLRLAHDEIEHLAKVAERERIARDLHDVLGHTLSLITLKSELARKLVDRDPARAKQEMLDIENTSRAALADVREAIRGYRSEGFFAELGHARAALETAGVSVNYQTEKVPLNSDQECVLALALREAVTNVVRHADARQCSVRLLSDNRVCRLEISDDGVGGEAPEGNGLRGMRERLESIGGSLERITREGTRLVIQLPLAHEAAALRNS